MNKTTDNSSNLPPSSKSFLLNNDWHTKVIGLVVGSLMITLYLWMMLGLFDLMVLLYHAYFEGWSHGAELMIKNVVVILASLELIRVLQSYLEIGRVKVTFILDVALVVLIGELISFWYREYTLEEVLLSIGVIAALVVLRIVTMKYSPDLKESE